MKMVEFCIESVYGNIDIIATDKMFQNLMSDYTKAYPREGYQFKYWLLSESKVGEKSVNIKSKYIGGIPFVLKELDIEKIIELNKLDRIKSAINSDSFTQLKNENIKIIVDGLDEFASLIATLGAEWTPSNNNR